MIPLPFEWCGSLASLAIEFAQYAQNTKKAPSITLGAFYSSNPFQQITSLHVKRAYGHFPLGTSYGYGCSQVLLLLAHRHQ